MDVFKILSRSTKYSKGDQNAAAKTKLPSSGETSNPQLFGHDRTTPTEQRSSKKRKRGEQVTADEGILPGELDFFGGGQKSEGSTASGSAAPAQSGKQQKQKREKNDLSNDGPTKEAKFLSEEECKSELRRHKIKVTVVEEFGTLPSEAADKKNKRKKKKLVEEPETNKSKKKPEIFTQPLTSFEQLRTNYDVSHRLLANIDAQGYRIPTEVQLASMPILLGSQQRDGTSSDDVIDLLTVAPTGSGKTLAFLIPSINAIMREKRHNESKEQLALQVLVLAPTKELAAQIANEGRKLTQNTGVKISLMRKGMKIVGNEPVEETPNESDTEDSSDDDSHGANDEVPENQKNTKRKRRNVAPVKAHILVSTPLGLINALKGDDGQVATLPSVVSLILDEADVLLDPLFREQTMSIWTSCINPSLRVTLWSATMSSSIESTVKDMVSQRHRTGTSSASHSKLLRVVVGLKDTAIPNITHNLTYCANESGKLIAVRQLLRPATAAEDSRLPALRPPFIIFTQTIQRALALHAELLYDIPPEAGGSARIGVLHSTLSESARSRILAQFRAGEIWVLVTTDILARGIDFKGLNGVVNYDVPTSAAAYVHRVGRTGRAGREGGTAVTLWAKEDIPHVKIIANVIAASEKLKKKSGAHKGGDSTEGIQQWLLDALPTPSKQEKQMLKKRGVEARRPTTTKGGPKTTISTKVHGKKGNPVKGAKRSERPMSKGDGTESESDFAGFDE